MLVGSHGCMLYVPCCTAYYCAMPPYAARTARTRRAAGTCLGSTKSTSRASSTGTAGFGRLCRRASGCRHSLSVCRNIQPRHRAVRPGAVHAVRRTACAASCAAQACVGGGTWRVWTNAQALGLALDFYQGKASAVVGLPREREALQERANWPHLHQNWPHLHQKWPHLHQNWPHLPPGSLVQILRQGCMPCLPQERATAAMQPCPRS